MKKGLLVCTALLVVFLVPCHAGLLDTLKETVSPSTGASQDESTIASGLKEALSIGTENAVKTVSQTDGYFGNQLIKILMPKNLQKIADVLGKVGYQKQVDDFLLSMNRAAEKAAPRAASIFGDAVKEMTLQDARGILGGGDTAATDYFKEKTSDRIYTAFKPIISTSLNEVGATKAFKAMMDKYTSLPLMTAEPFDLDRYVTEKGMDGLFYMVGQEEKKIRTNPAARVTDLLKNVFGK